MSESDRGKGGDFATGVVMFCFYVGLFGATAYILFSDVEGWEAFMTIAVFSGFGLVLGFMLTLGYWTTDFLEEVWEDV